VQKKDPKTITIGASASKKNGTKSKSIYESFLPNAKANFKGKRKFPKVEPSELNTKQRLVYDELLKYLEGDDPTPFRMVVAGDTYTFLIYSCYSIIVRSIQIMN